jgi:hypothetical protein
MNGLILGVAMLASSTSVTPAVEASRQPIAPAALTFDLPDPAPGPRRLADEASRPVWNRAPWQTAQPAPPKRFSKVDRIIAVAAGVGVGWVAGGGIGYYATANRDNYDDGTSGLKGMVIGAPIGAAAGAILGYRLTK